MRGYEEVRDRLDAVPHPCLGCTVTDSEGRRCYLERGHSDRPHLRVTHTAHDGNGNIRGLGWAEWDDDESLIDLPIRPCPHEANDRASCRHIECEAWRAAVVESALDHAEDGL